jgi:hypothetical protein
MTRGPVLFEERTGPKGVTPLLHEHYRNPGTGEVLYSSPLGRRPSTSDVVKVLETEYNVPRYLVELLTEAAARTVARIVDAALAQKRQPQSYFIVRQLEDDWLQ